MAKKSKGKPSAAETIRSIRRATRKMYTADGKIRIVLEGLRGESGIRELCRREGIAANLWYSGSKEIREAGKQRLVGDTQRQATSREVSELRAEVDQLKHLVEHSALPVRRALAALGLAPTGAKIRAMLAENLERPYARGALGQMGGYVKRCHGLHAQVRL